MNRLTIIGRSGADAEVRYLPSGMAICEVSIATSKNTAKQGEAPVWTSTWHKVVCWGKHAEQIAPRIRRGSKVYAEGELQMREWEKDGVKRQSWSMNAKIIEVIDTKVPESTVEQMFPETKQQIMTPTFEEDIPF